MKRILVVCLSALALSGCGLLAEVGVLDESYKGSFVRGDLFAAACNEIGGEWQWKPGTDAHCDADLF